MSVALTSLLNIQNNFFQFLIITLTITIDIKFVSQLKQIPFIWSLVKS